MKLITLLGALTILTLSVVLARYVAEFPTSDTPALVSGILLLIVGMLPGLRHLSIGKNPLDYPLDLGAFSYVLFTGVGPIGILLFRERLEMKASDSVNSLTLIVSWLGFFGLLYGHWLARFWSRSHGPTRGRKPLLMTDYRSALGWGAVIYTIGGMVGTLIYLKSVGGLIALASLGYSHRGNASLYEAGYSLLRPGLLAFIAWVGTRDRRPSRFTVVLLLSYITADLLWFGPLRGSRFQVITLVMSVVVLYRELGLVRTMGRSFMPGLICTSLALVLIWGAYRTTAPLELLETHRAREGEIGDTALQAVCSPFDTLNYFVNDVPEKIPYLYGYSFFASFTVFIPRAIWTSKPDVTVYLQDQLYHDNAGGSATTFAGELYVNFGIIGVIFGCLAVGMFCVWLERRRPTTDTPFAERQLGALIYAAWYPVMFTVMWGASSAFVWHWMLNIAPLSFVGAVAHNSSQGRAEREEQLRTVLPGPTIYRVGAGALQRSSDR